MNALQAGTASVMVSLSLATSRVSRDKQLLYYLAAAIGLLALPRFVGLVSSLLRGGSVAAVALRVAVARLQAAARLRSLRARGIQQRGSRLLALPEPLLREVGSWCADARDTAALCNSCRCLRRLRHDPAACALLLLRRPCANYRTAVRLYGGRAPRRICDLVYHLLHYLQAPLKRDAAVTRLFRLRAAEGGGSSRPYGVPPLTAPAGLLPEVLAWACGTGAGGTVRQLLALPAPPDVDASQGWALRCALESGPHHSTVQALLEGGADPCADRSLHIFDCAVVRPAWRPLLPLLLEHCRTAVDRAAARMAVLQTALGHDDVAAAALVLPAVCAAGLPVGDMVDRQAMQGKPAMLRLLLDHQPASVERLSMCLALTCQHSYGGLSLAHKECAALLVQRGADLTWARTTLGGSRSK